MITSKEALELPRVRLTEAEQQQFQFGEAVITATLRDHFNGRPLEIPIPLAEVSERVIYALKRRFEKPQDDGSRWTVALSDGRDASGAVVAVAMRFEPAPPADSLAVSGAKPLQGAANAAGTRPVGILAAVAEEIAALQRSSGSSPALSTEPVLSVLFGTYNRINHLKAAVESVRRSMLGTVPYEIVVCDGGSTDGSREWLAAQRDVIFVAERHLEGAVRAFNQCFALSRGKYLANLNDDCEVVGMALAEGVKYLDEHADVGQVAFAFRGDGEEWTINEIYPTSRYSQVTWPTTYANFGITRREAAEQVARITGGFWCPVYKTYAADCELSAWIHKLGWRVAKLRNLRVADLRVEDGLRDRNRGDSGVEAKRMYARWPAEAFKPDGPDPRVTAEELARFHAVRGARNGLVALDAATPTYAAIPAPSVEDAVTTFAGLVGFPEPGEERRLRALAPRLRALDPKLDAFPVRGAALTEERVLHISLCTDADPQAGLVRALRALGSRGYEEVRWFADYGQRPEECRQAILDAAARLRPTFVFAQVQAVASPIDAVLIREIRQLADPSCVVATWDGDIASDNSVWGADGQSNLDAHVPLARACDITFHSSMTHVRALRAAGVHGSSYLQIGYDEDQYRQPTEAESVVKNADGTMSPAIELRWDVAFLGSRYGGSDAFSRSMKFHDGALRDEVVEKMRAAFGERFGLFGRGWGGEEKIIPLASAHEVYWQSKVGLNVSLANFFECYTSDRLHRILGCGALLLTKSFPSMGTYGLVAWKNCLVFETAVEAVDLAKAANGVYRLDEDNRLTASVRLPSQYDEIAAAGAALAREHHTWMIRMLELRPYLEAVRASRGDSK